MLQPGESTFHTRPSVGDMERTAPVWPLLTLFTVLFVGPVIAPLFQATQLWPLADLGALARDLLSTYVCPTPAKSYVLLGYPMAVCARCWGATIGLWLAWFVFRWPGGNYPVSRKQLWLMHAGFGQRFAALSLPARVVGVALPFLLWVAEIRWWPGAPLWVLLANGALAGFGAGLLFCSLWPGVLIRRTSVAARAVKMR